MLQVLKKCKRLFLILAAVVSVISCKKTFLDVDNTTQLYRQAYVKDLNTMEQFKNGAYVLLNNSYENGLLAAYPDLVADNLKPFPAPPTAGFGTQSFMPHYTWSQQATEAQGGATEASLEMNSLWIVCYQIIRACSFVVEDVDKYKSENPQKADDIKGQALAIRALVHFKLVNVFAQNFKYTADASHQGVPYITTSNIGAGFSRQTVAQVYDAMIADLNEA
ncbi:MAG TPA: RagB/SusD family nutrient uptake outer membrane protein, partial [Chitinophagaceae bacterium]|nr:RagB/SusD family nutrient uptake outer membrane protein [Chitinophagaceae bacterium]